MVLPAFRWFPQLIKVLAKESHRCGSFGEDEGRGDKQPGGAQGQPPVMPAGRRGPLFQAGSPAPPRGPRCRRDALAPPVAPSPARRPLAVEKKKKKKSLKGGVVTPIFTGAEIDAQRMEAGSVVEVQTSVTSL